jgi:hypothetical protein
MSDKDRFRFNVECWVCGELVADAFDGHECRPGDTNVKSST